MTSRLCSLLVAVQVMLAGGGHALQDEQFEPDPAAARAFQKLVESYRSRPALAVKTTLKIELVKGEIASRNQEVQAEMTYAKGGAGIVKLRGFTCYVKNDVFSAIHESTDHSYYTEPYEDSPYWAFLINFQDIPFPHLAILWGEREMEDLWMQMHPKSPWLVPTAVEEIEVEGKAFRRIILSSPDGKMSLDVEPEMNLIRTAVHEITGGRFVEAGTKMVNKYTFEHETFEKPVAIDFDAGERQRVDMLGALVERPVPAAGRGAGPGVGPGVAALLGEPAPEFVLATADGGAISLQELRGQVVVLDFWATWCGPCRIALPLLHEVARWSEREDLPVTFVTVNVWEVRDPARDNPDARRQAVEKYWKEQGFTLPVAMDYADEAAAAYRVTGIPLTLIVRADGIVHARHDGMPPDYVDTLKRDITEAIDALEGK